MLPQENFCSDKARGSETNCTGRARRWAAPRDDISEHNEKATAGNTSRIVKGADKIMDEIALLRLLYLQKNRANLCGGDMCCRRRIFV